jgi:hypothetical protein
MTSSSSSEPEHDEHDWDYEPLCKRTTGNDGAGPSVIRFDAEDESTWAHQQKCPICASPAKSMM